MARLELNISNRPFRNDRLYVAVFGGICLFLFLFTAYNFWTFVDNKLLARSLAAAVEENRGETQRVRALLQDPGRQFTRGREKEISELCSFMNGIIARRNFSWTLLFNELERVTPLGVRVSQIAPSIRDDRVSLMLNCVGRDLQSDMLGFVQLLNESKSFSQAFVGGETREQGGMIQFPLAVDYHPDVAEAQLAARAAAGPDGGAGQGQP